MKAKNSILTSLMVLMLATSGIMFSGCREDAPAEDAGEQVDQTMEDAGDTMQDTGESVEESAEEVAPQGE